MLALSHSLFVVFLTVNFAPPSLSHNTFFSVSLFLSNSLALSLSFFLFLSPPSPPNPPSLSFLLFPSFSLSPQGQTDSHIILDVYRLGVVTVHSVYKVAMGPIVVNIIVICVYVYELARLYAICAHTCVCQPFWLHGYYTQTLWNTYMCWMWVFITVCMYVHVCVW